MRNIRQAVQLLLSAFGFTGYKKPFESQLIKRDILHLIQANNNMNAFNLILVFRKQHATLQLQLQFEVLQPFRHQ